MKLSRTKIAQLPKLKTQCLQKLDHNNNGERMKQIALPHLPSPLTQQSSSKLALNSQLDTRVCVTMVWAIPSRWRITAKVAQ